MHTVTIVLDRIFDVQRIPSTRFITKHTLFSFESVTAKKYSVRAPGWPRLECSDELIVILRDPKNWQTLEGWLNVTTGQIVHADITRISVALITSLLMAGTFALHLFDNVPGHPLWSPFWAMSATAAFVMLLRSVLTAMRTRRQLLLLKASITPSSNSEA